MKDRRIFSPELTCEAASLAVNRGYAIAQVCKVMGKAVRGAGFTSFIVNEATQRLLSVKC